MPPSLQRSSVPMFYACTKQISSALISSAVLEIDISLRTWRYSILFYLGKLCKGLNYAAAVCTVFAFVGCSGTMTSFVRYAVLHWTGPGQSGSHLRTEPAGSVHIFGKV